jgi:hypothetical protein
MITHDESEMGQFELHWRLGRGEFDDLLEMARAAPGRDSSLPVHLRRENQHRPGDQR